MLRPRITPCLLVHEGGLVKTVGFKDPKYVGDPINAVKIFNEKEADELIVLDIDASRNGVEPDYKLIEHLAAECRMPLAYGGGVRTPEQAKRIIGLGVEKVCISSAAIEDDNLVGRIADAVGRQSVVVVLDVRKKKGLFASGYELCTLNATRAHKGDPIEIARRMQAAGAGEIVINSIDRDGLMKGYDLDLAKAMRAALRIPMSVLGGAGSLADIEQLVQTCGVIGAAAGSLFVFKGQYRAVLINYPNPAQKDEMIRNALKALTMFKDKTLLITGGTGSFGNAVLRRFLDSDLKEIRILSRDEKKQDDMRKKYAHSKLKFYIADVRDARAVTNAMRGVDFCFHAAALKQVPSCEFHPMEAVRTNVLGTENVLQAAIEAGVARVVCLSTDKAVYPINAMGISKAMMEKVMVAASRNLEGRGTVICGTRYGNVMASRGSVIPLFVEQVRAGKAITITDPAMTRFMMTLDDAVELVMYAFEHGNNGDIFVQKAPAATVRVLAESVLEMMGVPKHEIREIGTRHGEKLYEALLSREERASAEDRGEYFRIPPDGRDLNYTKFVEQGETRIQAADDYTSHNTVQLDKVGMKALLLKLDFMQRIARGEHAVAEE